MIKRFSPTQVEVNEYIEKFSEIKEHLDLILEYITMEEITIVNDGCSENVIRKMIGYIENHDVKATRIHNDRWKNNWRDQRKAIDSF